MEEETNNNRITIYGTYNGIPVFIDQYMEQDRVLTMNNTDAKPNRETRVKEPRTKGLMNGNITAFIVHPEVAHKLKELL